MSALTIWRDGHLEHVTREESASFEAGLHYGFGVFEGIRSYATPWGPAVFRLPEHLDRLARGAALLGMTVDAAAITDATFALLARNGLTDAYVRPLVYRAGGALHLDVSVMTQRTLVATLPWTSHLGPEADRGVQLTVSAWRRNHREAIPPLKLCGGYVNAALNKADAKARGFDSGLYVDGDRVVEGTAENVFVVHGDRVVSVVHPDALDGITRQTVVTLSGAEARGVTVDEVLQADEVFLVGTSAEVTPVTRFCDRVYPVGPVTRALRDAYQDVVHGRDPARTPWLTFAPTLARSAS